MAVPAASIIIPTHNRAHLLGRALASLQKQSFTDFEVIVVDDASEDCPKEVVHSFNDSRFHYMTNQRTSGSSGARNTGIVASRASLICFLDDDDEWSTEILKKTVELHRSDSELGFSWCGSRKMLDESITKEEFWQPNRLDRLGAYLTFLHERRLGIGCGVGVKRSALAAVGLFDERLNEGADGELLARLFRDFPFSYIADEYITYHQPISGERLSTKQDSERYLATLTVIREHASTLEQHSYVRAMVFALLAMQFYGRGDQKLARRAIVSAIGSSPLSIRPWKIAVYYEGKRARTLLDTLLRW